MKPKVIVGIIFGSLLLIILLQNTQVVSVQFLFWKLSMSRILLLLLSIFVGLVAGFFIGRRSNY